MKSMTKTMAITAVLCSLLVVEKAQSQLADTPWPMFHRDLQHTGRSPYAGPDTVTTAWVFESNSTGEIKSVPAIGSDGTIYLLTARKFLAINPNGTVKWEYESFIFGDGASPAIGKGGNIFIPMTNKGLVAFRPDGTIIWQRLLGNSSTLTSSPVINSDGTIYVGSRSDTLYAINPDGSIRWRYGTGDDIDSSPAIGLDGTIYFASKDGYLYAIHSNGTLKWNYFIGGTGVFGNQSSPTIGHDGTVYCGGQGGKFYAITSEGNLLWEKTSAGLDYSSPVLGSDSTIFVFNAPAVNVGRLRAYSSNGVEKWSFELPKARRTRSPLLDAKEVLFLAGGDKVYVIDKLGNRLWTYDLPYNWDNSVILGKNGWLYASSSSTTAGKLLALAPIAKDQIPDLTVSSFSIYPQYGSTPGGPIRIGAYIKDIAGTATAGCEVAFYYNSKTNLVGTTSVFVPIGDSAFAEVNWQTQGFSTGDYEIIAEISRANPQESDTTNNTAQTTYRLLPLIQPRIDSAQPGETVWVEPGLYYENIRLRNDITVKSLQGPGVTVIDGRNAAVTVDAAGRNRGAVLEGFTIQNGKGSIITGGGINLDLSSAKIRHNIITGNDPYGIWHRGFQEAWIEGNLIINNKESGFNGNNSQAIFLNNTVVTNPTGLTSIGFYVPTPTITNCIFWGNQNDLGGTARAVYSDIQDGDAGSGNIALDPQFVDPLAGNYQLQLSSPCLDGGDPTLFDADGSRSDMGAYPVFQGGGRFGAPVNLRAESADGKIKLQWDSPPPILDVNIDNLVFDTYDLGWAFSLRNTGLGRLNWTATSDQNWLSLLPQNGATMLGTGQLIALASRKNLEVGEYTGNIIITSNGGEKTIPVTLKVANTPEPGRWSGSGLSFTVSENMRQISGLSFRKSSGNSSFEFTYNGSIAIASDQTFTVVSGDITITGKFDTRKTASGTYQIPFPPSPSGTWSASLSGNATEKAAASQALSGELASEIQLIAGYNIYRATASGAYDTVYATVAGNELAYEDTEVRANTPYYYIVDAFSQTGELSEKTNEVGPIEVVTVGVQEKMNLPTVFALSQNYPNPFNPETKIRFEIPRSGKIRIRIYNTLGQEVRTLVDNVLEAGHHEIQWHGDNDAGRSVGSGIYIYRMEAEGFTAQKAMVFLK